MNTDVIAEIFLIWESESRYVLDKLTSWLDQLGEDCIIVHVFMRKDTPDKEKPKERSWIKIHESRTATHSASRTSLVAYVLQNYQNKRTSAGDVLDEDLQRPRVKFQIPLYIVQEFEDQYEELMSLLRGSVRFNGLYDIRVIGKDTSIINDLVQNLEDLRQAVAKTKGEGPRKRCTLCSLDLEKDLPSGRNSRRGSYYACGHETNQYSVNELTLDTNTKDSPRSVSSFDNISNWMAHGHTKRLSLHPNQVENLCVSCLRRRSLFQGQGSPRSHRCTCGAQEIKDGRTTRHTWNYPVLCEGCQGGRRTSFWPKEAGESDELFCQGCMSQLMRKKGAASADKLQKDHECNVNAELCPNCQASKSGKNDNGDDDEYDRPQSRASKGNESDSDSVVANRNDSPDSTAEKEANDDTQQQKKSDTEDNIENISPRGIPLLPKGPQKYYCQFCPQKVFDSQRVYEVHVKNSHKRCNCGCQQLFENRNEYIRHFYDVFPIGCFEVRKCPERFRSLYYQALHHKEEHFSEKPFFCVPCYRESLNGNGVGQKISFKDMKSLRLHGDVMGHTDQEMYFIAKGVENREQNQPKLTLRSTAINFSG